MWSTCKPAPKHSFVSNGHVYEYELRMSLKSCVLPPSLCSTKSNLSATLLACMPSAHQCCRKLDMCKPIRPSSESRTSHANGFCKLRYKSLAVGKVSFVNWTVRTMTARYTRIILKQCIRHHTSCQRVGCFKSDSWSSKAWLQQGATGASPGRLTSLASDETKVLWSLSASNLACDEDII